MRAACRIRCRCGRRRRACPASPLPRTCGNALVTRPLVAPRLTSRSASSGTRTVIDPDVVSMCTSRANGLSRSQVTAPEMVRACTRSADDSARLISPETVSMTRSPATPIASIEPETVLVRTVPPSPITVIEPLVTSTVTPRRSPEATTEPADHRQARRDRRRDRDDDVGGEVAPAGEEPPERAGPLPPAAVSSGAARRARRSRCVTVMPLRPTLLTSMRAGPSVPTTRSLPCANHTSSCVDLAVEGQPLWAVDEPSSHSVPPHPGQSILATTVAIHRNTTRDTSRLSPAPPVKSPTVDAGRSPVRMCAWLGTRARRWRGSSA